MKNVSFRILMVRLRLRNSSKCSNNLQTNTKRKPRRCLRSRSSRLLHQKVCLNSSCRKCSVTTSRYFSELEEAVEIDDEIAEQNKSSQSHTNSSLLSKESMDPLEVLKCVRDYLASATERFSDSDSEDDSDSSFERVIRSASASDKEGINSQETEINEEPLGSFETSKDSNASIITDSDTTNDSASLIMDSDSEMSE